jgi:hypothetical protein
MGGVESIPTNGVTLNLLLYLKELVKIRDSKWFNITIDYTINLHYINDYLTIVIQRTCKEVYENIIKPTTKMYNSSLVNYLKNHSKDAPHLIFGYLCSI